ncbi:annexin A5-like [Protopterus annectens]|uniref:annexin A5-like n=1 Tax=Protopterus annectens TaxID=7888 RepID=UPI001CF9FC0A|nr:annexin A5-like [Protopterus annectens]
MAQAVSLLPFTLSRTNLCAAVPVSNSTMAAYTRMAYYKDQGRVYKGTVKEFPGFDPEKDAAALRKAMKGLGTDEDVLIDVLVGRSNEQRQKIAECYKSQYGLDLCEDIQSEVSGSYESLLTALLCPADKYDAREMHKALKGAGTSENVLIEILTTRPKPCIQLLRKVYQEEFGSSLEDDIKSDTSGYFVRVLVSLLQAKRDDPSFIDHAEAKKDAKVIFDAGEKICGTDEEAIISILCTESRPQLLQVFQEYQNLAGKSIEESLKRETSGTLEAALLAIVACIRDPPTYFAEQLYCAMKGSGTNEATVIRVMVSRSEIDLQDIKAAMKMKYGTTLHSMIQGDIGGYIGKALLKLCGGND